LDGQLQRRGFYCNIKNGMRQICYAEEYDIDAGKTPTTAQCNANYGITATTTSPASSTLFSAVALLGSAVLAALVF
jgi:hypothetical protein